MKNTTPIKDMSQAITHLSTRMEKGFGDMEKRFGGMDEKFEGIDKKFEGIDEKFEDVLDVMSDFSTRVDERFEGVDQRLGHLDSEVTKISAVMVTKDYLDEKLADLRGDLVALARKSNRKLSTLVDELVKKGSLSAQAAKKILAMEPLLQ
jgi:archaellum component FlaC